MRSLKRPLDPAGGQAAGNHDITAGARAASLPARPVRRSEVWRAWRRFVRYRPGIAGLAVVVTIGLVAIFANLLAPYSPLAINPGRCGRTRAGAPASARPPACRD